jgi:hypothetical protein
MTITLRIEKKLEHALRNAARDEGVSKSEVLRRCLREYLSRRQPSATPWEIGQHLFGRHGSGRSDLSTNRKKILREKIRAKKGRR